MLSGAQTLEGALTDGVDKAAQYIPYSQLAPETLVGFVPYPEQPLEIIVVRLPFTQLMVPAISLRPSEADWEAEPQFFSSSYLLRYEGIVLTADWLKYLVNLAATLNTANALAVGVDNTLLAIGTAWEWWENNNMTWPERCRDLARTTNAQELTPNTLMYKCKRHDLVRRDKKAS